MSKEKRGGSLLITTATVADSLAYEDFASKYLHLFHEEYHGNIEWAYGFAKTAHSKQRPRDTGEEFFHHPLMATEYLIQAGCRHADHVMGCLTHDVDEDGKEYVLEVTRRLALHSSGLSIDPGVIEEVATYDLLERNCGFETAEIVGAVSKSESFARTQAEKDQEERDAQTQLIHGPPGGWVVKAADRLHNLRTPRPGDTARMLRKIDETRRWYIQVFEMGARAFPGEGVELIMEIHRTMRMQEMGLR